MLLIFAVSTGDESYLIKAEFGVEQKELERYKQLLLAKREELSAAWKGREELAPSAGHLHGDPADQASAASEAAIQVRLHQTDSKLLRAIDDALARISKGNYGTCEACSEPISDARLTAVPWTRLCLNCKEQQS
ncbi:MAG: TraR/DksA family transcriptional regulator [Acidobacteriota bacterium]